MKKKAKYLIMKLKKLNKKNSLQRIKFLMISKFKKNRCNNPIKTKLIL